MKSNDIFLNEIQTLQTSLGLVEEIGNVEVGAPVMAGHFRYHTFHNGLSMHATDAVEKQNSQSALELPAGLSFNFIFSGTIDYSFADQRYVLKPDQGRICCSAIVNTSPEIMTRFMRAGMGVKKVNVFVERPWLEDRCQTDEDFQMLNRLFTHKRVCHWIPDQETLLKAERLLVINKASNFAEKLEVEYLTVQLLSNCIDSLNEYIKENDLTPDSAIASKSKTLKHDIEALMDQNLTLSDIAEALNMSERTLQRRFQSSYQQTVASYIKQRRMEKAKKVLVIEGRTIGEAAYVAGYNHPSNFVNAFKKSFGMTPAEFVKTHRGLRH